MKEQIQYATELAFGPAVVLVCLLGGDPQKIRDVISGNQISRASKNGSVPHPKPVYNKRNQQRMDARKETEVLYGGEHSPSLEYSKIFSDE